MQSNSQHNPSQIGDYPVEKLVGVGGIGKVFLSPGKTGNERLALKVIHSQLSENKILMGMFHQEMIIYSSLDHENIVSFKDCYFEPPLCYIVTKFVDGFSGRDLSKKLHRLPPLVALCIYDQLVQAIGYLHIRDLCHGDISSKNFMVDYDGKTLVLDFGLANLQSLSQYRDLLQGTKGYMSPEHFSGEAINPSSDIYCLGINLFEMIEGYNPFHQYSEPKVVYEAMQSFKVGPLKCNDNKLAAFLQALVSRSMAFNSGERPGHLERIQSKVRKVLLGYGIHNSKAGVYSFLIDRGLVNGFAPISADLLYQGYSP